MNFKKLLAFFLVAVLLVVGIVGCGPKGDDVDQEGGGKETEEEGSGEDEESSETSKYGEFGARPERTYTILAGNDSGTIDLSETRIGKLIKEYTGVTLEYEAVVGGDIESKVGVMIASGEYPDIIWGGDNHQKFLEAGAAIPLDDLIEEYGENTKIAYDEATLKKHRLEDGHIYFLSPYREELPNITNVDNGFWLIKEVVKLNDYPSTTDTTIDEFFDMVRDYVKDNPEYEGAPTIGFTFPAWESAFFELTNPPMFLMGYPNDGDILVHRADDPEDYEVETYATSDGAKRYYKLLNELWHEGLLDKEIFTQNEEQYQAKLSTGRVVSHVEQFWQFGYSVPQLLEQDGKDDRTWVPFGVTYEDVERGQWHNAGSLKARDGMSISTSAEDPEGVFIFLDDMLSEEIQKLYYWGVEGEDYTVDDDGMYYRTPEQREQAKDEEYSKKQGLGAHWWGFPRTINDYSDGNAVSPDRQISEIQEGYSESDLEILEAYNADTWTDLLPEPIPAPYGFAWDIHIPDDSDAKIATEKMGDARKKYYPMLIMEPADKFDEIWDEFVAEWEETGYEVYEEFMLDAIKERTKAWTE